MADVDVTGFDAGVPPGEDRAHELSWERWPVHVVCYHPLHFAAVARTSELLFVFMREIRKLQDGVVLFDDHGDLARTLDQLSGVAMPHRLLQPLVDAVAGFTGTESDTGRRRLGLYHAVENLSYAWMHLDARARYSKHKWLLDDARLVPSRQLVPFLRRISAELVNAFSLETLATAMRPHAADADGGRASAFARNNLRDAETLLQDDRRMEAVWPLRMSGYMLAQALAQRWDLPYPDLRSLGDVKCRLRDAGHPLAEVFRDLFLLDVPIATDLFEHWEATRSEFFGAWRRVGAAAPGGSS